MNNLQYLHDQSLPYPQGTGLDTDQKENKDKIHMTEYREKISGTPKSQTH